jgi:hypothetical protein
MVSDITASRRKSFTFASEFRDAEIPRSVLSDKDASAVWLRQRATSIEGQPERSGMIADRVGVDPAAQ